MHMSISINLVYSLYKTAVGLENKEVRHAKKTCLGRTSVQNSALR